MTSQELAVLTAELALTKKAENVISMDLRGLTTTCDFFVICHGTSGIQVAAIANAIKDGLTEEGEKPWHIEGTEGKRWILLDCVDVVVHVFDEPLRRHYDLELIWGEAPHVEWREKSRAKSRPKSCDGCSSNQSQTD